MAKISAYINPRFTLALATLALGPTGLMHGEAEAKPVVELDPYYITVSTRTPLSEERVSPSVDYISFEEMKFWQDRDLVDSLSRAPGVVFWSNGTVGSLTSLSIRGSESNHTSVFLDGRRLSRGFGNQYGIESLSVNNLSSVQVQRGSSSVNWGSTGIGGVIALQSEDTLDGSGLSGAFSAEFGSNNYLSGGASTKYSTGTWGYSFTANALTVDNERLNDDFEKENLQGRFDFQLFDDLTFEVVGQYTEAEKGVPNVVTNSKLNDRQWTTNWLISPGMRYTSDSISVHFFYSKSESEILNDIEDFFGSLYDTRNTVESDEVNLQVDYTLSDQALLTTGAIYRSDYAENPNLNAFSSFSPVAPYKNTFEQTGLWSQLQWQLTDQFEVRAGLRRDFYSDYDDSTNGSIEFVFNVNENSALFAKIATSYAPPSALDFAFDEDEMIIDDGLGGELIVSNSTPLEPEESLSYEIGFKQQLMDAKLDWSIVLFRNEIKDLITFVSLQDENDPVDFFDDEFGSDTLNVDEATTEGAEISIGYFPNEAIDINLGYTYLTATNDSEGKRLAYRPRHQLQLSGTYRATDDLSVGLSLLGQFDRERGRFMMPNLDVEDYVVVNLVINWDISEDWSLFGRAENLLDEAYAPVFGYPALGRAGYIGARYEF